MQCIELCDHEKTLPEGIMCLFAKCAKAVKSFAEGPAPPAAAAVGPAGSAAGAVM